CGEGDARNCQAGRGRGSAERRHRWGSDVDLEYSNAVGEDIAAHVCEIPTRIQIKSTDGDGTDPAIQRRCAQGRPGTAVPAGDVVDAGISAQIGKSSTNVQVRPIEDQDVDLSVANAVAHCRPG